MKKIFTILASILTLSLFCTSCKRDPEPLRLPGIWSEQKLPYYDTLPHSMHSLKLDCPGTFEMVITSYHKIYPGSESLEDTAYKEFIKGKYVVKDGAISFNGNYYTGPDFHILADSNNTSYSYGLYIYSTQYKIDDTQLTLGLNDMNRNDISTFHQKEAYTCY
ncbi:MAG: hypothetical protein RRX93_02355 [Bacteroidales bacterium]